VSNFFHRAHQEQISNKTCIFYPNVEIHYEFNPKNKTYAKLESPKFLNVIYIPTLKIFGEEDINDNLGVSKVLRVNEEFTDIITFAFNTAINNKINHIFIPPIGELLIFVGKICFNFKQFFL
jgi:hypothetical protein